MQKSVQKRTKRRGGVKCFRNFAYVPKWIIPMFDISISTRESTAHVPCYQLVSELVSELGILPVL